MYRLQKRMRVMLDVIVSVSHVDRPRSKPDTSWARVSCLQRRILASAEVLVGLSRVEMLGSNAVILWAYQKRTEVALRSSGICSDSRLGAYFAGDHLVYGSS
jgi:hypothetical protein